MQPALEIGRDQGDPGEGVPVGHLVEHLLGVIDRAAFSVGVNETVVYEDLGGEWGLEEAAVDAESVEEGIEMSAVAQELGEGGGVEVMEGDGEEEDPLSNAPTNAIGEKGNIVPSSRLHPIRYGQVQVPPASADPTTPRRRPPFVAGGGGGGRGRGEKREDGPLGGDDRGPRALHGGEGPPEGVPPSRPQGRLPLCPLLPPPLLKILSKQGDSSVLFADKVLKFTGTGKMKRRILLITDFAIYLIDPETYALKRRIALAAVERLCLSELSDNFFAIIVPTEYDCLMASTRKTEIVTMLVEATKTPNDIGIEVAFSNRFEYNAAADMVKEIQFEEAEGGVRRKY